MVVAALMTALVVVLQCMGAVVKFGPFSVSLVLIPIVIGTITCGEYVAAWLGFVFALVVILTGGANLFFAFSIHGTIITVFGKGIACGYVAGLVYKLLKGKNKIVAAVLSALVCPVVNTGIFLLGSAMFFMPFAQKIADLLGIAKSGFGIFIAMALGNLAASIVIRYFGCHAITIEEMLNELMNK
jgi:uncharacterized membrane protein